MSIKNALAYIAEHESNGHHVDNRVKRLLESGNPVISERIENGKQFLRLLYHDNQRVSGFLTPYHAPRTLRDVIARIESLGLNMLTVARRTPSIPTELHDPQWFLGSQRLYENGFKFSNFGRLFLMDLIQEEQAWSPNAYSSIYDGTHRSLVLAWLLIHREIEFQPVDCFIFRPRPVDP